MDTYISFTNSEKYKVYPFSQFPKVPEPEIIDRGIFNGKCIKFIENRLKKRN